MTIKHFSIFLIVFSLISCNSGGLNNTIKVIPIKFELIKSYPHDTTSFTEGFLVNDGKLYESTGAPQNLLQTKSLFGIVDLATGKIDIKVELDRTKYFGEGITILNAKVYQLTYETKIGFVYDAITFKKIGEFTYPSKEGWGLTTDGTNLIMSDGTFEITYLDPITFRTVKKVSVTENNCPVENINELEYIKGYIFANIWPTNTIIKIDPTDGIVVGKLDLTILSDDSYLISPNSMEMNGIAYNSLTNKIFVTGKLWPRIYELEFK